MSAVNLYFWALLQGLGTSAGLIMAIGAQNAFVLSQGLKRQYHWQIAGVCSLLDAVMISLGVMGMGVLISQNELWLSIARWGGAAFLFWYGLQALRSAFKAHSLQADRQGVISLKKAILTALAVTLLNPHAYLDTVVLIGSIGGQYPEGERLWFALGAISFSFIWFFGISISARWLAPVFRKPSAWRVLDASVCLMMWAIAVTLISR